MCYGQSKVKILFLFHKPFCVDLKSFCGLRKKDSFVDCPCMQQVLFLDITLTWKKNAFLVGKDSYACLSFCILPNVKLH